MRTVPSPKNVDQMSVLTLVFTVSVAQKLSAHQTTTLQFVPVHLACKETQELNALL